MTVRQGVVFAASFVAVIILAKCGVGGLSLNLEIRVVELATLLVTVFIALFVTSRLSDRRAEKDLLISNLRDVFESLKVCRDKYAAWAEMDKGTGKGGLDVGRAVRELSNAIDTSRSAVEMSMCSELTSEYVEIRTHYRNYKAAVTGGPFPSKGDKAGSFADEDRCYRAPNLALQSLLFKINRRR